MVTVTIPKTKYNELKKKAEAYELMFRIFEENLFTPPPIRSRKQVISAFRKTEKYSSAFLKSFEKGLQHSSYFTK